jgi:phage terminase small subunit
LLGDNLDLYNECRESVRINGIYNAENGKKNPLLTTMKDLQATIIKQIQHLGLSPYAVSKIKDTPEDDTDSYIEALTNGE